jgi:hypothetical protein
MKMDQTAPNNWLRFKRKRSGGSVMIVTMALIAILMLLVGTTMISTTDKYFTAYQWASWQEALQGAESGADIAMAEMRKDVSGSSTPWIGWTMGSYKTSNGKKMRDSSTYKTIANDGTFADNSGGGGGNNASFNLTKWTATPYPYTYPYDFITYSTSLTPHAGEGNTNLRITVTVDKPSSLIDSTNRQWLRVRATGTTDLTGPSRVSAEKLDNRLRKLGLFWDKVLAATDGSAPATHQTTRQIELIAKPVTMFAGALTAMVQIKTDKDGLVTDSFNSEGYYDPVQGKVVPWPINSSTQTYDLTMSHDATSALGKNGDVASNAFPIKHDHSENLGLNGATIWGDVGNNYSQITNLNSAYYSNSPGSATNFGLDNGNYGSSNPTPTLITTGSGGGDVSGAIATNFYRDLPAVQDPNWTLSQITNTKLTSITGAGSYNVISTDPKNPDQLKLTAITLGSKDIFAFKPPPVPKNSPPGTVVNAYVTIWVTGDIQLDDGGTLQIVTTSPDGNGNYGEVHATIYVDHNIKVGQNKETKTNSGGFDVQSDDAKDLLILGVTQPDSGKLPKDQYVDPLGNGALYTPYMASGNISFTQSDFTGAIYAPDHNIVFNNTKDGKGKRKKRQQAGNDFYGSYVGRTINLKDAHNIHYDESLNDVGPQRDWGYVSWFEDVDVDNR